MSRSSFHASLAGVNTLMCLLVTRGCERFETMIAFVRLLASVSTSTQLTLIRLFAGVRPAMRLKLTLSRVARSAHFAPVRFLTCMSALLCCQVAGRDSFRGTRHTCGASHRYVPFCGRSDNLRWKRTSDIVRICTASYRCDCVCVRSN